MRSSHFALLLWLIFGWTACQSGDRVGAIVFDDARDDPAVQPCGSEEDIHEYYRVAAPRYGEGLKTVRRTLAGRLDELPFRKGVDGYFTVRFLVNCRGKANRFRKAGVDSSLHLVTFPDQLETELFAAVQTLQDWQPATQEGNTVDSYYFLTFKIRDGRVAEILP